MIWANVYGFVAGASVDICCHSGLFSEHCSHLDNCLLTAGCSSGHRNLGWVWQGDILIICLRKFNYSQLFCFSCINANLGVSHCINSHFTWILVAAWRFRILETKKLLEMYLYKLNYPIIYSGSVTNHNYALGSPKMYEIGLLPNRI